MSDPVAKDLVSLLQRENLRLRTENASLKQQLQSVQAHSVVVRQGSQQEEKLVADWTLRDFISYFKDKFYEYTCDVGGQGEDYRFNRRSYVAALSQLGQFAKREHMTNDQLKELVDYHFQHTFNQRLSPSIPFICSAAGMNAYHAGRGVQHGSGEFVGSRYAQRPRPVVQHQQVPPSVRPEDVQAVDDSLCRLSRR